MAVDIVEPTFSKILADIDGAEGPVFDVDGKFYMVEPFGKDNDIQTGKIWTVDLQSGKNQVVWRPNFDGCSGIPAGLQCDKSNTLWVADMALGLLQFNLQDGTYKQVIKEDSEGNRLQGCNDLIFDYDGNLWITAPGGPIQPHPDNRKLSFSAPSGSLYCYTKDKRMIKIETGFWFPNGIAVRHDEKGKPKQLIVAETRTKHLWLYDIIGPGKVINKRLWATLESEDHEMAGPDGMDFDIEGNLIVTNQRASMLEVYGPDGGQPVCRIKCPFTSPSNVHFKPGTNELYVTEHQYNGLWCFKWRAKGAPQYCEI